MDPLITAVLMGCMLLVMLLAAMPVGFAMGITGLIGLWLMLGFDVALPTAANVTYHKISDYVWTTIPLFIIMGHFAFHAGFVQDFYALLARRLGGIRGGLAMATSIASAGFAACSGSSLATVATMGRISIGEMLRHKYDVRLAVGSVAAAGTMGSMIPPSIYLIVYAMFAEQSISRMFLAGLLPGLLEAIIYCATIFVLCRVYPDLAPALTKRARETTRGNPLKALCLIILVALVLGGIYSGLFTPTEAGAVGAFSALLMAISLKALNRGRLFEALSETAKATIAIFIIVVGAVILSRAIAITNIPADLSGWVSGLPVPPMVIILAICAMYIVLGMFIDPMGMILLTLPVVLPVVLTLGYDPIWFGIVVIKVMEIGLITPPLGLNIYMLKSTNPGIPLSQINRGILWFFIADLAHLAIILTFPQVSLFLPSLI